MLNIKLKNNKGVSLTLIIGLVSLLMITSAGISELIIANMRSVQRIEASNKAYFIAEAGLEDALYELSSRFPGYETPSFDLPDGSDNPDVRSTELDGTSWKNEWQIESRSKQEEWGGKFYKNEKLMIFLFKDTNNDDSDGTPLPLELPNGTKIYNAINDSDEEAADIDTLNVSSDFSITFTIPKPGGVEIIANGKLKIDNDDDFALNGVNEDPPGISDASQTTGCPSNPEDNDCDGLVDEDSALDPVILWKLTDGEGKSLMPKKGCLGPPKVGSEICEDDFGANLSPKLTHTDIGIDQDGAEQTIGNFISGAVNTHSQLHFEFLIIAPMEHVQGNKKLEIPYIEYVVKSNTNQIPNPFYTIKSDGYFREFKQSITATLTPKTTVPLFDFTIIQQQ